MEAREGKGGVTRKFERGETEQKEKERKQRHTNIRTKENEKGTNIFRSAFAVSRARIAPDFPLSTQ